MPPANGASWPVPVGSSEEPPTTPSACAETPIHAAPASMSALLVYVHSGSLSTTVTLSHSTTTAPLNRAGSPGRRTTKRVLYGAVVDGVTVHVPSADKSPAAV